MRGASRRLKAPWWDKNGYCGELRRDESSYLGSPRPPPTPRPSCLSQVDLRGGTCRRGPRSDDKTVSPIEPECGSSARSDLCGGAELKGEGRSLPRSLCRTRGRRSIDEEPTLTPIKLRSPSIIRPRRARRGARARPRGQSNTRHIDRGRRPLGRKPRLPARRVARAGMQARACDAARASSTAAASTAGSCVPAYGPRRGSRACMAASRKPIAHGDVCHCKEAEAVSVNVHNGRRRGRSAGHCEHF